MASSVSQSRKVTIPINKEARMSKKPKPMNVIVNDAIPY
jgi:hypothetical protein